MAVSGGEPWDGQVRASVLAPDVLAFAEVGSA